MCTCIIYLNELSCGFEGLPVEDIRPHVERAIATLQAVGRVRSAVVLSLPQALGQITLGANHSTLAAILPGSNNSLSLLKRFVDKAPFAAIHNLNEEVKCGGRIAVGLSWVHHHKSLGLSFGHSAQWSDNIILAERHVLESNDKLTTTSVEIGNLAIPAHAVFWRTRIEEYGKDVAPSSIVYQSTEFVMRMFFNDHGSPHVHIYPRANGTRDLIAKIRIETDDILEGHPSSALRRTVLAVITSNRRVLLENWNLCREGRHPCRIGDA